MGLPLVSPYSSYGSVQEYLLTLYLINSVYYYYPRSQKPDPKFCEEVINRFRGSNYYFFNSHYFFYVGVNQIYNTAFQQYVAGSNGLQNISGNITNDYQGNVIANYAKLISDTSTAFFMGNGVTYECENEKLFEAIKIIFEDNYEQDHNFTLALNQSIYGVGYELLYLDEVGNLKLRSLPPQNVIIIHPNDQSNEVLYAIRYFISPNEDNAIQGELYDKDYIYKFDSRNGGEFVSVEPHYFGIVPIIPYRNNNFELGDFVHCMDMITSYNIVQTQTAKDFYYFSNAILMLSGYEGTNDDDLIKLLRDRVLLTGEGGDAKWILKDLPSEALESFKKRLQADILTTAQVPNFYDENLGGGARSGQALKYRLYNLEQLASTKQRNFQKSLQERIKAIKNWLNLKGGDFTTEDRVHMTFHRNLPSDDLETAEWISKYTGIISERSQLELVPFIEDVEKELELKKQEREEMLETSMFSGKLQDEEIDQFIDQKNKEKEKKGVE